MSRCIETESKSSLLLSQLTLFLLNNKHNIYATPLRSSYFVLLKYIEDRIIEFIKRVGENDKMRGFAKHLIGFPNKFNKFSNTGTRMQDSVYHMTLKSHFIGKFCTKTSQFRH